MSGLENDEAQPATTARPGADRPADDGAVPAADGWVMGAWTPEGFQSATSPVVPPEDEPEGPVAAYGDEPAGEEPAGPPEKVEPGVDAAGGGSRRSNGTAEPTPGGAPGPGDPAGPTVTGRPGPPVGRPGQPLRGPAPATTPGPLAPPSQPGPVFRPDVAWAAGHGPGQPAPQYPGAPFTPPQPPARPRADASTAAELTEDAIVRHRSDRPSQGWRGSLFKMTGGLVNPGVGPAEKARQEQLRRIRRPLPGSHQIAVSSIKGGVGKTSVASCLGLVLAENRGDRVIALDANPDAGTLADRLTGETSVTVRHLLDNIEATHSLTDVARYTSLAGRLQVLASEQDPAMSEAFNRDEYERVCEVLTRFYNIVITDSGTGLVHSAMEGTLALADSLVVVGAPTVDGASRASKTLDWLIAHGHAAQVANAIVVLSCDRTSKEVDRSMVRGHFEARCRAVVEVPHDPHLATGGRIELHRLHRDTHDAFLNLAAQLADGFVAPTRRAAPAAGQAPGLP